MTDRSKIRLFVDAPLAPEQAVALSREQAHYLFGVMRLVQGDQVTLFNGRDGAWRAVVAEAAKKRGVLVAEVQSARQADPPDLWLCFAPIKKARTDFIVEKATEMGAARIAPVLTEFTNSDRVRVDRLQAHAVEAAEQCGGTFVPPVATPQKLGAVLDAWPAERQILFCDEALAGENLSDLKSLPCGPWAILIGPEGGFSASERTRLHAMPQAHAISLGPRILRADTAAVAALALWQCALGDWT